jgi:hypothetical protein
MIGTCSGTHIASQGVSAFLSAYSDERRLAKRAPDCFALSKIYFGRAARLYKKSISHLEFRCELNFIVVDKKKNWRRVSDTARWQTEAGDSDRKRWKLRRGQRPQKVALAVGRLDSFSRDGRTRRFGRKAHLSCTMIWER